jgi:hypothetical protein
MLPLVSDSDRHEALRVRLETVRLSGARTVDLMKALKTEFIN